MTIFHGSARKMKMEVMNLVTLSWRSLSGRFWRVSVACWCWQNLCFISSRWTEISHCFHSCNDHSLSSCQLTFLLILQAPVVKYPSFTVCWLIYTNYGSLCCREDNRIVRNESIKKKVYYLGWWSQRISLMWKDLEPLGRGERWVSHGHTHTHYKHKHTARHHLAIETP